MTKDRKNASGFETKKRQTDPVKNRELTDEERIRLAAFRQRAGQTKPLKFKSSAGSKYPGGITAADPADPLISTKLAETLGTTDSDVQGLLFDQVVQSFSGVAGVGDEYPDGFNPDKVIGAASQAVALLAVQMIAVHNAAMHTAKLAILSGQTFDGKRTNMNYTSKLMALFTSQMEALKKYRTGGQQKMVVEHVHVNEGGQAVVGPVTIRGGTHRETEG